MRVELLASLLYGGHPAVTQGCFPRPHKNFHNLHLITLSSKSKSYFNYTFHVFIDELARIVNLRQFQEVCYLCFCHEIRDLNCLFFLKSTSQQASISLSNCMKTQEKWERNVNTYNHCPFISSKEKVRNSYQPLSRKYLKQPLSHHKITHEIANLIVTNTGHK